PSPGPASSAPPCSLPDCPRTGSTSKPSPGDLIVKRISFWFLSTLSAVVLLFGFAASRHAISLSATAPITSGSTGATGAGQTSGQGSGQGSGNSTSGSGTDQSNGNSSSSKTVTGEVAQTEWGPVQVQLVVKNGTITAVSVVQYPSGNSHDD